MIIWIQIDWQCFSEVSILLRGSGFFSVFFFFFLIDLNFKIFVSFSFCLVWRYSKEKFCGRMKSSEQGRTNFWIRGSHIFVISCCRPEHTPHTSWSVATRDATFHRQKRTWCMESPSIGLGVFILVPYSIAPLGGHKNIWIHTWDTLMTL